MIKLKKGYVINPDPFWKPSYRISPFTTQHISINKKIVDENIIDHEVIEDSFGDTFFPCFNGRSAIALALKQYDLTIDDEVWIVTTSGNNYISSCVTNEIEKICNWSTSKSQKTKLIFVNHEFGFVYKKLQNLKEHNLPIIEDKALSFASVDNDHEIRERGDFVIYSLPKFFPVSFGGVLKCNYSSKLKYVPEIDQELIKQFFPLMTAYLSQIETIKKKRLDNFNYLKEQFLQYNFEPFFHAGKYEIPGVFMYRTSGINLAEFKTFMQANGVESSVFYGEEAFFIPVHQGLNREDMDFFFLLTSHFIESGNQ